MKFFTGIGFGRGFSAWGCKRQRKDTDLCYARFTWLTLHNFNLEKIKSIIVIGYLSIFLLVCVFAVSSAMEARITSFEWKRPALEGRALLGTHAAPENTDQAPPPLISPVSPKHMKANYSMVATLTILMVIAVGAIFCCCYQWETRLRGQSEAQSPGHSELAGGTRSSSNPLQDSVSPSRTRMNSNPCTSSNLFG